MGSQPPGTTPAAGAPGKPGLSYIAGKTRNALARAQINSGKELAVRSSADLLLIPGFGPKCVEEAERALKPAVGRGLAGGGLTGWEPGGIYAGTWRDTAKARDAARERERS